MMLIVYICRSRYPIHVHQQALCDNKHMGTRGGGNQSEKGTLKADQWEHVDSGEADAHS